MLGKWFVGALGAALFSLSTLSAQTGLDCASGNARGAWDLPAGRPAGYVKGLLVDQAGHSLMLEGRLTPLQLPDGRRGGLLDGLLFVPTTDGTAPRPVAEAHGVYTLDLNGRGHFESRVLELPSDLHKEQRTIGKLAGAFADPMYRGRDPVGRFVGQWAICR